MGIPAEAYLGGTVDGYLKSQPEKELNEQPLVQLRVQSDDGIFTNKVNLLFSDQADPGLDVLDAPKLSAKGLAEEWLSFYSMDGQGRRYAMQSLPTENEEKVRIPLGIETTQTGIYEMEWRLPSSGALEGSYFLRDNQSGQVIELLAEERYRFEVAAAHSSEQFKGSGISLKQAGPMEAEPRFELLVAAPGADGLTELGAVPEDYTLAQNYPNPFNPTTVISYQLPVASQVRLAIYDMLGREVATLIDGEIAAGRHSINFNGSNLSSGVYLYRLQAGNTVLTRKLTIMK